MEKKLNRLLKENSKQWELEKKLHRTDFSMVLVLTSLSVLSGRPFKKHTPGAQVRAHAAVHACNRNYDDNDFTASHTEICQNYDVHCSVRAIRLIMEWLP